MDPISPNNPVCLIKIDGHEVWINSKALQIAGITKDTPNPEGGIIEHDEMGEPTGILKDSAMLLLFPKLIVYPEKDKLIMWKIAQEKLFKIGITSIASVGRFISNEDTKLLKKLYKDGDLKIRNYVMLDIGEDIKYIEDGNKPSIGLFDNRLSINAVKIFADGSFSSQTAFLTKDYVSIPNWKGEPNYTEEELEGLISRASDEGFQISTHAIGDAAVHRVLNAYEKIIIQKSIKNHRFRIEHISAASDEDIERIAKLNIVPSIQGLFPGSTTTSVHNAFSQDDFYKLYNWQKLICLGTKLSNGSDTPTDSENPFHTIWASITFKWHDGQAASELIMCNRLSRVEALQSYTIGSAYAEFGEKLKGSLEVGKLADFVILDRDIMQCPVQDIKSTQVLETILGGETVYKLDVTNEPKIWIWTLGFGEVGGFLETQTKSYIENNKIYIPIIELVKSIDGEVLKINGSNATISYNDKTATVEIFNEKFVELVEFCNAFDLHWSYYKSSNTASIIFK